MIRSRILTPDAIAGPHWTREFVFFDEGGTGGFDVNACRYRVFRWNPTYPLKNPTSYTISKCE